MYQKIPLSLLKDNPHQPRFNVSIDDPDIVELAKSIEENGLIQEIKVSYDPSDEKYFVIFGHRRVMAYKRLGREEIEAVISTIDAHSKESRFIALVENVQRKNLNPIELAKAYQDALDSGLTLGEIAEKVGKSKPDVTRIVKILNLSKRIHAYYNEHKNAKKDELLLYELSKSIEDESIQYELFIKYQNGQIGRAELLRIFAQQKPKKSEEKYLGEELKIAYDHQGIKLRAPILSTLDKGKKVYFETEIKKLIAELSK